MRSTRRGLRRLFLLGSDPDGGQHDALDALAVGIEHRAVNWILDAEAHSFQFFDTDQP